MKFFISLLLMINLLMINLHSFAEDDHHDHDHGHDDDHAHDLHGDVGDFQNRFQFPQHDGDDFPAEGPLHFQIPTPAPGICRAGNSSGSFLRGFHLHVPQRYPKPVDDH